MFQLFAQGLNRLYLFIEIQLYLSRLTDLDLFVDVIFGLATGYDILSVLNAFKWIWVMLKNTIKTKIPESEVAKII